MSSLQTIYPKLGGVGSETTEAINLGTTGNTYLFVGPTSASYTAFKALTGMTTAGKLRIKADGTFYAIPILTDE